MSSWPPSWLLEHPGLDKENLNVVDVRQIDMWPGSMATRHESNEPRRESNDGCDASSAPSDILAIVDDTVVESPNRAMPLILERGVPEHRRVAHRLHERRP